MIDELLRSFLASDSQLTALASEIAVGEVPADADGEPLVGTYIWFSFYDEEDELDLDGNTGLTHYRVDLEACSTSTPVAKRLAYLVKKKLQAHSGAFGSITVDDVETPGTVQAVYVESKDDDYQSVNAYTFASITAIAMEVTIHADDALDALQGD